MLAVEGYFDGDCVRLSEPVNVEKNQRVIVTFIEDTPKAKKPMTDAEREAVMEALLNDKFVSPVPTGLDVDAYMKELRGYETNPFLEELKTHRLVTRTGLNADEYIEELRNNGRV